MGDSAGSGLALALSTGLRPGAPPAPRAKLPRAALVGYPVVTFDARQFLAQRSATARGGWVDTPAESEIAVRNTFLPPGTGKTAEAAQQQIRGTLAGAYYFFGQRLGGLLPADVLGGDDDAAAGYRRCRWRSAATCRCLPCSSWARAMTPWSPPRSRSASPRPCGVRGTTRRCSCSTAPAITAATTARCVCVV